MSDRVETSALEEWHAIDAAIKAYNHAADILSDTDLSTKPARYINALKRIKKNALVVIDKGLKELVKTYDDEPKTDGTKEDDD